MIRIPYVIDNIAIKLADVLNELLAGQHQPQLDIATAYFSVRGFELVRTTLPGVRHFRLLLGDTPKTPAPWGCSRMRGPICATIGGHRGQQQLHCARAAPK